jgi:hypothetical protein
VCDAVDVLAAGQQATGEDAVTFEIKSPEKSFQVRAPTMAAKWQWLRQIGECVAAVRREKGMSEHSTATVAATWESDHAAIACKFCQRVSE